METITATEMREITKRRVRVIRVTPEKETENGVRPASTQVIFSGSEYAYTIWRQTCIPEPTDDITLHYGGRMATKSHTWIPDIEFSTTKVGTEHRIRPPRASRVVDLNHPIMAAVREKLNAEPKERTASRPTAEPRVSRVFSIPKKVAQAETTSPVEAKPKSIKRVAPKKK